MNYQLITTPQELKKWCSFVKRHRKFSIDTETTGTHAVRDRIILIPMTCGNKHAVVPLRMLTMPNCPLSAVRKYLGPILKNRNIVKRMWNAKFDMHMFTNDDMPVQTFYDGMVAAYLYDENRPKGLKERCKEVDLELSKFPFPAYFRVRKAQIDFDNGGKQPTPKQRDELVTLEKDMLDYAFEDTLATEALCELYEERMNEDGMEAIKQCFHKVWTPLVRTLYRMERRGFCVDINFLNNAAARCKKDMEEREAVVYQVAGKVFNINSTPQLQEILYDQMGLPVIKVSKKTGAPSADAETLELLSMEPQDWGAPFGTADFEPAYPICGAILEYRKYSKLYSTYLAQSSEVGKNIHEGRLHTSYNSCGTDTGRLSSSGPNLQNIPRSGDWNSNIRKMFVPPQDHVYFIADFSQFEVRIITDRSKDKGLTKVYSDPNGDLHDSTQKGCGLSERTPAKVVNFSSFYGIVAKSLATKLTIATGNVWHESDAQDLLDKFWDTYGGVPRFMEKLIKGARKRGYVTTYLGRRRRLPDLRSSNRWDRQRAERQAFNAIIQGGVADIMNLGMIRVDRDEWLNEQGFKMVGQVHDEIHAWVPRTADFKAIKARVKEIMEHPFKRDLHVPIILDCGDEGVANWHEGK